MSALIGGICWVNGSAEWSLQRTLVLLAVKQCAFETKTAVWSGWGVGWSMTTCRWSEQAAVNSARWTSGCPSETSRLLSAAWCQLVSRTSHWVSTARPRQTVTCEAGDILNHG